MSAVEQILAAPRAAHAEPEREVSLVDEVERILGGGGAQQQPERDPDLFRPIYQPRTA